MVLFSRYQQFLLALTMRTLLMFKILYIKVKFSTMPLLTRYQLYQTNSKKNGKCLFPKMFFYERVTYESIDHKPNKIGEILTLKPYLE